MQCELDANVEFLVCVAAAGSSLGAGGAGRDRVAADASCRRLLAGRAEAERMMTEKLAAYVEAQAAVIAGTIEGKVLGVYERRVRGNRRRLTRWAAAQIIRNKTTV
jgi:hypothetical protein